MSSALKLDEFSLEMRMHYIATSLEDLERVKKLGNNTKELILAIESWVPEAQSNHLNHFVSFLEGARQSLESGDGEGCAASEIVRVVASHLEALKLEEDSQALTQKFLEALALRNGEGELLYLQCEIEEHLFVIPVNSVVEIVTDKKIHPLPFLQEAWKGLIAFRGQGIPVVNLKNHGFSITTSASDVKPLFVICNFGSEFFALEVHRTNEVVRLKAADFQSVGGAEAWSPVAAKFVLHDGLSLLVLDLEKLVENE